MRILMNKLPFWHVPLGLQHCSVAIPGSINGFLLVPSTRWDDPKDQTKIPNMIVIAWMGAWWVYHLPVPLKTWLFAGHQETTCSVCTIGFHRYQSTPPRWRHPLVGYGVYCHCMFQSVLCKVPSCHPFACFFVVSMCFFVHITGTFFDFFEF